MFRYSISWIVSLLFVLASTTAYAQMKDAVALKQMLVGKTITVQGSGAVPYYKLTLNADGSFIHCAPTTYCEVQGLWTVESDGKLIRKYKNILRGGERVGYVSDTVFNGAKILNISDSPMIGFTLKDFETFFVGKIVHAINPAGEKVLFSPKSDGRFQMVCTPICDDGVWKMEGNIAILRHDNWRPDFAPDGVIHFPIVKDGGIVYFRALVINQFP